VVTLIEQYVDAIHCFSRPHNSNPTRPDNQQFNVTQWEKTNANIGHLGLLILFFESYQCRKNIWKNTQP